MIHIDYQSDPYKVKIEEIENTKKEQLSLFLKQFFTTPWTTKIYPHYGIKEQDMTRLKCTILYIMYELKILPKNHQISIILLVMISRWSRR